MSGNNNLCQGQGTVRHACYPPLTSSEQWSVGTSAPDIVHEPIPVLRGAAGSAQESTKLISIVVGNVSAVLRQGSIHAQEPVCSLTRGDDRRIRTVLQLTEHRTQYELKVR